MRERLNNYKNELAAELHNILNYWIDNTVDKEDGGFYGKIDNDNQLIPESPKGSVLNARILWSFSAAYNHQPNKKYLELANRAYTYITCYFIDAEYGGVYWSVDHLGNPLDTKKQVYASAFTIYALSEFYKATGLEDAKQQAIHLYQLLVDKSYDNLNTGYLEAFTREWQPIKDLRLSAKDANEKEKHEHTPTCYGGVYCTVHHLAG